MDEKDPASDPTADYRKYAKGPNFLGIVILSAVVILLVLAAALFVVSNRGRQIIPHRPTSTPNSSVQPLRPTGTLRA